MELFGDHFSGVTMRDICQELIEPICRETGTSFALHKNPEGLQVDAFVTHSWDGPFGDFVDSIRNVFETCAEKPNLWICAFALVQGNTKLLQKQIGADDPNIENSPFVIALNAATKFVVVRNVNTDIYSRIWCVCELVFADRFGFVPQNTHVAGPSCFSELATSCIEAQASKAEDKVKIFRVLLLNDDEKYLEIDAFVHHFRAH